MMTTPGIKGVNLPFNQPNNTQGSIKNVYDSAATENAQNYDDIMHGYDSLQSKASNNNSKLNYVPINPIFDRNIVGSQYTRSNELNSALTGLNDYSKTGGYSEGDIGNIRERAISPIRAIYSSAQEGLRRQKVLQGGYSPNYGAVSAKMARDSSSQIGDITTKVNAEIAQMVANGKLSGLNSLGSLSSHENDLINNTNSHNADLKNQVEEMNTNEQRRVDEENNKNKMDVEKYNNSLDNSNFNNELNAVQGKQSLYSSTPGLTNMFANQVLQNNEQNMQAVQTANMIKNQRANIGLNLVNNQLGLPQAGVRR